MLKRRQRNFVSDGKSITTYNDESVFDPIYWRNRFLNFSFGRMLEFRMLEEMVKKNQKDRFKQKAKKRGNNGSHH